MSQNFAIINHTADIQIRAWGHAPETMASHAALAMASLIIGNEDIREEEILTKHFSLQAIDRAALMVDFLSELLTWIEIDYVIPIGVEVEQFSPQGLTAIVVAARVNAFEEEIKAVTYHGAVVHQRDDGDWETEIIFDI